ncbi:MAG: hypothetical protein VX498_11520 [Myxococcota bacterium]|nr:hypothetical protein [Myxococcota bacterium]
MSEAGLAARPAPTRTGLRWDALLRASLPWLVSIILLFWVFAGQDLGEILGSLASAHYGRFGLALACFLVIGLLLDSLFLYVSFRWLAQVGRFGELLRARAATELLMLVTLLAGMGGIVVYARKRYGLPVRDGTGLVLVDLLHEAAAIGALALLGVWIAAPGLEPSLRSDLLPIRDFALAVLGFYVLCVLASFIGRRLPDRLQLDTPLLMFHRISLAHFGGFLLLKVVKNLAMGLFVVAGLACFSVKPPVFIGVAMTQVVLLLRGLPVTAFGIGVDQVSIPTLFEPWQAAANDSALLGFAAVFTFSLVAGRAVLGVPFVGGVLADLRREEG